jgi:CHAT domain-containing protein
VIQPKTASQNLVLGGAEGTDANTLYFSTTDLTALATTFSGLTFGRSDGTGTVTVDSSGITLNSPSVIQTGSGSILLNGNISTPSQPLTVTGAMQLGNDVTLTTAATGAGNTLTLNGNLAGQNRLLNLATGSSTLVVNGLLGSESPLSSIGLTTASLLLNGGINTNVTLAPTVPITLTGNVALTSQTGNVDLRNAPITSQTAGSGVTVTSQQGNILAGNISTATATTGGAINLLAPNGSVTARNLNTSGQTGGAVFVQASDNNLNPDGAVGLFSTPSILLGEVNTSGSVGNGGNVTLDPLNAVEVSFINAQGGPNGVGGNVTITTSGSFFIARGTFLDQNGLNASISTAGGLGGGDITITHNGGDLFFPFNTALADATIFGSFPSGTAGVLTTGADNVIQNRAFPGSYTQPGGSGTIRIITSNRFETAILNSLPDGIEPENLLTIDAERPFPIEEYFTREFEAYFAEAFGITPSFDTPIKSLEQIQDELSQVERATGIKPAILYIAFFPQGQTGRILAPISEVQLLKRLEDPTDQLDLVLVTSNHPPIYRRVPEATREKVSTLISEFRQNYVISPSGRKSTDYLPNVQQFYQWLVAPIQTDLQALKIQNLTFITDVKLRSLPIATLHDGKDFIIRTYSVGFMPSMSLTNTQYADIKNSHVLAMGASDFSLSGLFLSAKGEAKARSPLPAVPLELELITTVWQGAMFLNEQFTREALERERRNPAYRIIHLATHAQFEPEKEPTDHAQFEPQRKRREMLNSFIQLWAKERLLLDQLRELRWYDPVVEMLVLSACETAVGDRNAELGFIGLATQAGVKTAVGSFWTVDDAGSSALMSEFYWQLKLPDVPIKAEAIRRAQLAMIEGRVRLENGQLVYSGGRVSLPPAIEASTVDFSHPYFWSAFTTVGSPW